MRALVAVLAVLLASCGGPAAAPAKTEDATAELKPLMEKLMADWSTMDMTKVAPHYAKDPGLPFYDIMPLKYNSWQEYEDGVKKIFAGWTSLKLTMSPDFKASKNGNIAWATFTSTFEITPKTGDVMRAEGRNTEILEKRGNDWVIVHEHGSVPMPEPPPPPAPAMKKKKK